MMNVQNLKKNSLLVLLMAGITAVFPLSAGNQPEGFSTYTLENGMKCFVFEDFSSALVRIEYSAEAGFSDQKPETAGLFLLYSGLFPAAGKAAAGGGVWYPDKMQTQCDADSSRYILTVTPEQVDGALQQIAACAFSPDFTDTELETELSAQKKNVTAYAFSTAGFINSSIDARMFPEAPWKFDSGIYPALFEKLPAARVRTLLADIAGKYYRPDNSALFISGGITAKRALALAETYFGTYRNVPQPAGTVTTAEKTADTAPGGGKKIHRYVLADPEISSDMTQIVIQFRSLPLTESDIIAGSLNAEGSSFKTALVSQKKLALRGEDYINIAAVHQKAGSRIIIQALLENTKESYPVEQAEIFLRQVLQTDLTTGKNVSGESDFSHAQKTLSAAHDALSGNTASFMNTLSQYRALYPRAAADDMVASFINRPQTVSAVRPETVQKLLKAAAPSVFVLVNSSVRKEYRTAFSRAGYELVTTQNGSWYTDELYKKLQNQTADTQTGKNTAAGSSITPAEQFIGANRAQFDSFSLRNGIPVTVKRNQATSEVLIGMELNGGRLRSTIPGFEELMINALAQNIQKKLHDAVKNGTFATEPEVLARTDMGSSFITVSCSAADFVPCLNCMSDAVIYGTITPAEADGLVYDKRSRYRIQKNSAAYQMFCAAIRTLYKNSGYTSVFTIQDELLDTINYRQILAAYPDLLDAGRYRFILTGRIPEKNLTETMEKSFGVLLKQKSGTAEIPYSAPVFPENGSCEVQLTHLFLTDVSADKAGPMPEKLVPTKKFYDPVQYWIPAPRTDSDDFPVFNALAYELCRRIEGLSDTQKTTEQANAGLYPATPAVPAAVITLYRIEHTATADERYRKAVTGLIDDLNRAAAAGAGSQERLFITKIKNGWIEKTLAETGTNRGTALLIRNALDTSGTAEQYLKDYRIISDCTARNFYTVAANYLPAEAPLRIYSKDSEK
jgi:zinc protease